MIGENKVSHRISQAVLWLICLILSCICIFPLLNVLATSLSSPDMIMRNQVYLLPKELTMDAYRSVLFASSFVHRLVFTILLTVVYTVLAMGMTILCAYPLSKPYLKGRKILMVFIVFTMYFDAGIIPRYLVIKQLGLLDQIMALVLPGILSAYNMIIMRNFFSSINKSIMEAAYIDGCNEFQTLVKIVLPVSTAVIATLSLFYAVSRWNTVSDVIYYITDPNKQTLQGLLREIIMSASSTQNTDNMDAGQQKTVADSVRAASVVLSTIPILCVYPFAQRYFTKGIMLGSVKG